MAYTKKTNKPVVTETVVASVETATPIVETVVEEGIGTESVQNAKTIEVAEKLNAKYKS